MLRKLAWIVFFAAGFSVAEESPKSFDEAVMNGEASLAIRYRYEFVDQDSFSENANASTARLRLNYLTGNWSGWRAFAEFDYIGEILADNYNSGSGTSPEREQYPVVADPDGPDLNQLYAEYLGSERWRARFGRQRIILDNQRFIGAVGWRQNEQTYDGISFVANPREGAEFTYAWVGQVNRIFGTTVPDGRHTVNTHLLNARFGTADSLSIVPYAYYIDNEDAPGFSTLSAGLRLSGGWTPGGLNFGWVAEYAYQEDAADAPVDYDASYYHLALDWKISKGLLAGIGFESLEGDDSQEGAAFRTPLATLYAFQGWADKFLTTPDAGVEDLWLKFQVPVAGWKLAVIYHDFSAESGGADYGSEIDVSAGYALSERYGIELRGAVFDSDNADFDDTTKLWFTFTAAF